MRTVIINGIEYRSKSNETVLGFRRPLTSMFMNEYFKAIRGIDVEKEFRLIKNKKSKLTSNKRKLVCEAFMKQFDEIGPAANGIIVGPGPGIGETQRILIEINKAVKNQKVEVVVSPFLPVDETCEVCNVVTRMPKTILTGRKTHAKKLGETLAVSKELFENLKKISDE